LNFHLPTKFIIGLTIILINVSCGKDDEVVSTNSSCGTTKYCIIFVSNTGTSGDIDGTGDNDGSNGIEEADTICNADSNKPNSSSYKAMIVDGANRVACTTVDCSGGTGEHVDWVLQASKEYRRADESTAIGTTSTEGIFTFPLDNTIDIAGAVTVIWTGLNGTDWTTHAELCNSWTDNVMGKGRIHSATVDNSMGNASFICSNTSFKLYCVEQ
jgi:hypothetical protein